MAGWGNNMKKLLILLFSLILIALPLTANSKTLVFPHLAVNHNWSFGLAVVNANPESADIVRIEIWNESNLISTERITIEPTDRWLFTGYELDVGTYTIIVYYCADWTFGTLIRTWKDTPIAEEPAQVIPYTSDLQSYNSKDSRYWVILNTTKYYTKAGKCPFMAKYHYIRFNEVLKEMYLRYKDINDIDPKPSLGDANAST